MAKVRKLSYTQSIVLFVVISVLPLYLFFMWVYQVSYSTIRKDLLTSISLEGEKIITDLDRDLSNAMLRLDETLNLQCTRRVMLEDSLIFSNYEIISAKQELAEIMIVMQLNSQVLESIELYFPRTGIAYQNPIGWSDINASQSDVLARLLQEPEQKLIEIDGEFLIYQTNRRASSPIGRSADIIMVMRLSRQRIAQLFEMRLTNAKRNIFLIKADTGDLVTSTDDAIASDIIQLHADGSIPSPDAIRIEGRAHYALAMHSSIDALTLYYIVMEDAVSVPMSRFASFLVVSLVLLALILLLLFV